MNLFLLGVAFLAGILTILAPCVLPVLPVIIGSSVTTEDRWRPIIITLSLAGSIVFFTLILKVSTLLINIPQNTWTIVSATIILIFGLTLLFPHQWETLATKLRLGSSSQQLLARAGNKKALWSAISLSAGSRGRLQYSRLYGRA